MKKQIRTIASILFSISCLGILEVKSQDNIENQKTIVSIETDPSTFAFKGYAAHVRIKPKNSRHLQLGAGTYALDLPSMMVNLNPDNKDKDWKVRISSAYSLFGEYYFKEANSKWFVGLQAGVQNYVIKNYQINDKESKYSNLLIMPSVGYTWMPFKIPFYLKPWVGLGYTTKVAGENSIQNLEYSVSPIVPFVTLHVGYSF